MTQYVNVIGVGRVGFPDDMTKEEIAEVLRTMPPPAAAPAMPPDTLGRQIGMATRPMAQAALTGGGLMPMVVDPMVNFFNLAAGTNIPTQSQAVEKTLTGMGFPEARTPQERVIQDVASAGYGTSGLARAAGEVAPRLPGMARDLAQFFAQSPKAQTAAALTASTAGGMLREGGAPPALQVGGAMLAGMVAPGGPKLSPTQRILEAPGAMVKPFTQAGREVIVLNRLATNPEQAALNLQQAQPLVPGVRVTTAAGARDPGLAAAETAIRALDQSGAFGNVLSSNQQALLESFRRLGGRAGDATTPGSIPYAEAKRTAITKPMREEAFAGVTVEPETFQRGINLVVNKAIDNVMSSPAGVRQDVESAMKFAADRVQRAKTPQELYEVRKDLAAAAQGKYNQELPSLRLAKGQLNEVIRSVDDVIEAAAPGFKDYMQQFQKSSSAIDQMKIMQGIESKVTTGQPNLMTGEPVLAAGALRRQLATKAEEIGAQLSPAAQTRLDNIINEINRGQAATAPGVKAPGSNTFQNMSMGNLIGRVFSESMADNTTLRTMTRPLDFLYKLPDQQIQQLLVEAMLDPKLAATMMGKANIMKVEPLAQSLRKKAEQMGFGAAIGATQEPYRVDLTGMANR
jgi:hypothetical protein